MSLSEDWRQRHSPRQSDSRVIIYIILLLLILLMISRAGNVSRKFTELFFPPSDSSLVHSTNGSVGQE